MLHQLTRTVYRIFFVHGLRGVLQQAYRTARYRSHRRAIDASGDAFDQEWHVETARRIRMGAMTITASPYALLGSSADPTRPEDFRTMLNAAYFPFEDCTFLDLGCGAGRALLMASLYPFKRIIGVEFAAELAALATKNIRRGRHPDQRCTAIEVWHSDATRITWPDGPLVVYLFNPFERRV